MIIVFYIWNVMATDVVTAFIAVIILWLFVSKIAKMCVFSHGKCSKCLFAEASELECFCWSHSFMLSVKMRPTNGGFSCKPSPHHLDLVVLPADIVLCMICWNLLLLRDVLQHSACLYFQRIVFEDWNHFDLAVSHFVFVLSDLFLTVCRKARQ